MASLFAGGSCLLHCQRSSFCCLEPRCRCTKHLVAPKLQRVFPARRQGKSKETRTLFFPATRLHPSYGNFRHGYGPHEDLSKRDWRKQCSSESSEAQNFQDIEKGGVRRIVKFEDDLLERRFTRTRCISHDSNKVNRVGLRRAHRHVSTGAALGKFPTGVRPGTVTGHDKAARAVITKAYISAPGAPSDGVYYKSPESEEELANYAEEEFELRKREDIINLRLVKSLVFKEKKRLCIVFASLVAATACTLSMPIFSGRFFETLIGKRTQPLELLLARLCLVYVLEPVFTVLFVTNMVNIWENVMKELRFRVFNRVLVQKVEFFDQHKVGELTSLLSTDLSSIKDIVNENVSRDRGFRSLSEVLGTVIILFILSPQLAPILSILMLSVSGLVAVYKRTTMPVFKAHGMAMARIGDTANETFSAIRTVRSFGGEGRQISTFEKQVLAYQQSGNKLGWLKALNESWTRMVIYVALMALYVLGGMKVKAGQLAVGKMVSFIGYTFTLTFAMQGLVNTLADLRIAFAAADRINSVIKTGNVDESLARGLEIRESEKEEHELQQSKVFSKNNKADSQTTHQHTLLKKLAWSGDVSLEDVYFSYPSRPDAEILKGVTLHMQSGTVTALVGSSGAGKSTIVQLLARFYEPSDGRISIAGQDVRKFDKGEWARIVAIVNQDPVLFAMSIADNIAYGAPDREVTRSEIVEAAKSANAHDFIMSLPEGYETLVGERGGLLSGGQRQRIAIARALLKNSPILILDEATSSLDSVSERLVQDALSILMKGRTTLVIAHRLSTVQTAHQIVVCGDGKVLEKGTHKDLLAKGGTYANLVNTQRVTIE